MLTKLVHVEAFQVDGYKIEGNSRHLLQLTKDSDPITYNTVMSILTDDVEHAEDLQSLLLSRKQLG